MAHERTDNPQQLSFAEVLTTYPDPYPPTKYLIADDCMRGKRPDLLPEAYMLDEEILRTAYRHYEAGRDEDAKAELQKLGLTSAYLHWKLMLRGLIALANRDTPRALENWSKIDSLTLPARLIEPFKREIGSEQPPPKSSKKGQSTKQHSVDSEWKSALDELAKIQKITGQHVFQKSLWKSVEKVVPIVRKSDPECYERLGAILYRMLIAQGGPSDLLQYAKLFPAPKDDPKFQRLTALACEISNAHLEAIDAWSHYEAWLATNPLNWTPEFVNRARAQIFVRIGKLIRIYRAEEERSSPLDFFGFQSRGAPKLKLKYNPSTVYQKSLQLAPDWHVPALAILDELITSKKWKEAEKIARDFLRLKPVQLAVVNRLCEIYLAQGKALACYLTQQRAQALNPLDQSRVQQRDLAAIRYLRTLLLQKRIDECRPILDGIAQKHEGSLPLTFRCFQLVLDRPKLASSEISEREAELLARPEDQKVVAFQLLADQLLAGSKPAARKLSEDRFRDLLADPRPTPHDVKNLLSAWLTYEPEFHDYKGRTTHLNKILALAERTAVQHKDLSELEDLIQFLLRNEQYQAVTKLMPKLHKRFKNIPLLLLLDAKALYHTHQTRANLRKAHNKLRKAIIYSYSSKDPRTEQIINEIQSFEDLVMQKIYELG